MNWETKEDILPVESTIFSPSKTLDPHQQKQKIHIHRPGSPDPNPEMIRYRECQRNHAAHLGGHVVDGCGEFMPAGEEGTPQALRCAACDCHRNFHRREVEGDTSTAPPLPPPPTSANCYISFNNHPTTAGGTNNNKPQKNPMVRSVSGPGPGLHRAPVMMAFGSGTPAESSSEGLNAYGAGQLMEQYSKKRFRTKFTQEQKEKMTELAERVGWRIQKQDESEVQRFCEETGIKRQVFKVWMHNNKQAMKRKLS